MATHSSLTDADGLHVPKGFASANTDETITKDSGGNLIWTTVCQLTKQSNLALFLDQTSATTRSITTTNTVLPFTLDYILDPISFGFNLNSDTNILTYNGDNNEILETGLSMSIKKTNPGATQLTIYIQIDTGSGFITKTESAQTVSFSSQNEIKNLTFDYPFLINNGDKFRLAALVTSAADFDVLNVMLRGRSFIVRT